MRNTYYVWLDDLRDPKEPQYEQSIARNCEYVKCGSIVIAWLKSYDEFESFIRNEGVPAAVDFDHDLGIGPDGIEMNGNDCAKFLLNYCLDNNEAAPEYFIHSANPIGSQNIQSLFDTFNKIRQIK